VDVVLAGAMSEQAHPDRPVDPSLHHPRVRVDPPGMKRAGLAAGNELDPAVVLVGLVSGLAEFSQVALEIRGELPGHRDGAGGARLRGASDVDAEEAVLGMDVGWTQGDLR
jgi:hypothetical protein